MDNKFHHKSTYIQNMTLELMSPPKHCKRSDQNQKRHSLDILHQSLDEIDTDSFSNQLSALNSINIINHVQEEEEKVGQVAGWAVNFDKLLQDISGLCLFTEFLKKEFSEENIIFWTTVEKYKEITNQEKRNVQAKEIFNKHLSVQASEPVNIDSVARQQADSQLDIPTPQIFDVAQHQIYRLMKQDSYTRFLKSNLYKICLLKELKGKPLDFSREENRNGKETDEKEKMFKKIKENENQDKGKRRRSLLPWRQKGRKNTTKSSSDSEAKNPTEKNKDKESLNLSKDDPMFGSKKTIIKKQVLFWIDLPNKKSIDVKVKPTRMIRVVLKPILHKYGLRMDNTEIYLADHAFLLDLEAPVSSLDNQRVVVVPNHDSPGYQRRRSSLFMFFEKRIHRNGNKRSSVDKDAIKGHICIAEEQSQKTPK
ncbi:hypothetical protein ACJMK2_007409 [Sinanodonta woodiana]|uniref:Uncharacterized protein n=1 Tax=Sinanodonta woodiana TaxID=1069815 RepID=A0ABD3VLE9_SINWO